MADAPELRIVHAVRSDSFAGVERSMALSARALAERGHQVSLIGGLGGHMRAALDGLDVGWQPAVSTLDVARALWRHGRADIVHAHMTAAELAAVSASPRTRGRLVVTRHFAQRRGRSRTGRVASMVIDHVPHEEIAISEFVAGELQRPSLVVPHGLQSRPSVSCEDRCVVVIQRLAPEKSTEVALRAWGRSGLAADGWTLVVAGDGAERAALEQLARRSGLLESVRFLGRVEAVDELRRSAGIQLATPSGEHFGLSVLEAMAVGLPVVATNDGAHPELLGCDHQDLMFCPGDVDGAAQRLRRLADDLALRKRVGAHLRQRQQRLFSLDAHGAALEAVYLRALGRHPTP